MKSNKRGVSLIVLVITIVLMIILASAVILSLNGGGVIEKARESVFKTRMKTYVEELNLSISNKVLDGTVASTKSVNVKTTDSDYEEEIRGLIGSIKKEDVGNIEVHDGILVYLVDSTDEGRYKSVDYLNSIGIIIKSKTGHCIGHHDWEEANYLSAKKCSICGLEDENYPKLVAIAPHKDQTETSDIGIGTDGQLVNLDLWNYSLHWSGSSVTGYKGEITDGRIQGCMPQVINNIQVISINNAFKDKSTLVYAPDLPRAVTTMVCTFQSCSSLTKVSSLPEGVIDMQSAFHGCSSLTEAPSVPNTVTNMRGTFRGCVNLNKTPNIPNGVTDLYYTFCDCRNLIKTPDIPNSVTSMQSTFQNCSSLTKAPILPNGVINLGGTFNGCSNLTETPNVPSTVTGSMGSTFAGCSKITKAPNIPDGITSLEGTFSGCSSLTETPNVPNSVTNIKSAFYGCSSMTETPNVPSGVTNIEEAFRGCSGLTETPNVPNGVTSLRYTFMGCSGLTLAPSVPGSVTNMQETFSGCTNLTGTINILAENVTRVFKCLDGITKSITLNVKENSTTYTNFNNTYGENSLITIVTN